MNTNAPNWLQYVTLILVVGMIIGGMTYIPGKISDATDNIEVTIPNIPSAEDIAKLIVVPAAPLVPAGTGDVTVNPVTGFPDYVLSEDEWNENLMEVEAERLAMEDLNSKSFREEVMAELNVKIGLLVALDDNEQEGLTVESYRDVEDAYSIEVEDIIATDIDEDEGQATMDVTFKVKYALDDDEDLVGKARVTVSYIVNDLVIEDNFEDAEAEIDDVAVTYLYKDLI